MGKLLLTSTVLMYSAPRMQDRSNTPRGARHGLRSNSCLRSLFLVNHRRSPKTVESPPTATPAQGDPSVAPESGFLKHPNLEVDAVQSAFKRAVQAGRCVHQLGEPTLIVCGGVAFDGNQDHCGADHVRRIANLMRRDCESVLRRSSLLHRVAGGLRKRRDTFFDHGPP